MSEALNTQMISVIVPVYKVEPYLRRCVDSILAQSYTNLEIILVDDGSPDNCPAICDEYAAKDDRVRVIHKPNGGLSDARNAGLDIATGEWLSFIDSDDWIESSMYEILIKNANKHDAQISIGGVLDELMTEYGIIVRKTTAGESITTESREKLDAIRHFLTHSWSAWDKIYRREVFDGIRYPVGEINEDEAIALRLLNNCDRVAYTNEPFYHYISRPESITTSSFSLKKLDWYRHCKANLEWIREHYPELEEYAAVRYRSSIMYSLNELALFDPLQENYIIELMTELKSNRGLFKRLPSSRSEKLRAFLLTSFPFGVYRSIVRRRHKK